ncbi:MAG TPA: hypothetical protein VIY28_04000 [Pseudonocardiaceae bacterium]
MTDARIEHVSRSLVFAAALETAGGWPRARLVLYGGEPVLVRALDSLRVTDTVSHAGTLAEALAKIDSRPPRVRRRITLEPRPDSVRRARVALDEACAALGDSGVEGHDGPPGTPVSWWPTPSSTQQRSAMW